MVGIWNLVCVFERDSGCVIRDVSLLRVIVLWKILKKTIYMLY